MVLTVFGAMSAACGDDGASPDPDRPLEVTVTVTRVAAPTLLGAPDGTIISCDVYLSAVATGTGTAQWGDAVLRWYVGADRTVPADTLVVPAADIREVWDFRTVSDRTPASTAWRVSAWVPFDLAVDFGYASVTDETRGTTSIRFTCGPTISASSAPPQIDSASVREPEGPVGPGGEVVVDFSASSDVGLWQTAVILSGPCDLPFVFNEKLATSTTRTVRIPLPLTCAVGPPISVAVLVLDAALRDGGTVINTGWESRDGIPPTLVGASIQSPGTLYFVGDTLRTSVSANDNVELATMVWEVLPAGVRDSVLLGVDTIRFYQQNIPVLPSWVGDDITLRLWVRDGAGLTSDTLVLLQPPTRVLPTVARPSVSAVVPGEPVSIRVDGKRGRIYLLQGSPDVILALDRTTLAVLSTTDLPAPGVDFDLTSSGDSLVVTFASLGALGVVDLVTEPLQLGLFPLSSLDSTNGQYPQSVRAVATGRVMVHLMSPLAAGQQLLELDLGAGTERIRDDVAEVNPGLLERSFDRTALIVKTVAGTRRYDAATDTFGAPRSTTGGRPSVDGSGDYLVMHGQIYDGALTWLRWIEGAQMNPGQATALAPSGALAYVSTAGSVRRADLGDGRFIDRTLLPFTPARLQVSDDGVLLVGAAAVFGTGTSRIVVIDLR